MNPETVERTLEMVGAESPDDLLGSFGGMSLEEVEQSLQECFPGDDIEQLAENVRQVCETI